MPLFWRCLDLWGHGIAVGLGTSGRVRLWIGSLLRNLSFLPSYGVDFIPVFLWGSLYDFLPFFPFLSGCSSNSSIISSKIKLSPVILCDWNRLYCDSMIRPWMTIWGEPHSDLVMR